MRRWLVDRRSRQFRQLATTCSRQRQAALSLPARTGRAPEFGLKVTVSPGQSAVAPRRACRIVVDNRLEQTPQYTGRASGYRSTWTACRALRNRLSRQARVRLRSHHAASCWILLVSPVYPIGFSSSAADSPVRGSSKKGNCLPRCLSPVSLRLWSHLQPLYLAPNTEEAIWPPAD